LRESLQKVKAKSRTRWNR